MSEHKFGEKMVRASVECDLALIIDNVVPDERDRDHLEEAVVELAHSMLEAGQTLGEGNVTEAEGDAYMRGFMDALETIEKGPRR